MPQSVCKLSSLPQTIAIILLPPLAHEIQLIIELKGGTVDHRRLNADDVFVGRPGPRNVAAKVVKEMDHGTVADLATRAILNSLMWKGKSSLLGLPDNFEHLIFDQLGALEVELNRIEGTLEPCCDDEDCECVTSTM